MRLRPTWAFCLVFGCLVFSSACGATGGRADDEAGTSGSASQTAQPTASQPASSGETLAGTAENDSLRAGDREDVVRGLGGDDEIHGGEGRDRLYGGPGDDVIDAQDRRSVGEAGRDEIFCGPGRDEVLMDANDGEKPRDCEMAGVGSS